MLCIALAAPAAQPNEQTMLILGDSISAAYGMSVQQGWVAIFSSRVAKSYPGVKIVNASISGETTGGGLRRLPPLLEQHKPDIVVVELGANDGLRGYPIKTFASNLEKIVKLSRASGSRVILVQMEIPPNYGVRYTKAFHETYDSVAKSTNSILSPFLMDGVAGDPRLIQGDGIHPTVEAQNRLMENILPTLMKALNP